MELNVLVSAVIFIVILFFEIQYYIVSIFMFKSPFSKNFTKTILFEKSRSVLFFFLANLVIPVMKKKIFKKIPKFFSI